MSILAKIGEILGSPVGSFAYHLVLLLIVQATLGMAWDDWQRSHRAWARRLLAVTVGLSLARLSYLIPALLAFTQWLPSAVLPFLERFANVTSILLVGMAFVPRSQPRGRIWGWLLGANLAVTLGLLVFTVLWYWVQPGEPAADLSASWLSTVWTGWQLVIALLVGLAAWGNRDEERSIVLLALLYLVAGSLLQLLYPAQVPNLPVWDRLAHLVAYPLIAVAIYQRTVSNLVLQAGYLQEISQASLDQIKSLLALFEASRQVTASLDLPTILDSAVHSLARALDADQCAIAFPTDGDPTHMTLEAIYNPARQGRGEPVRFPLEYQLAIQQALRRKKHIMVEELDNIQLKVLFALLGSGETGPLLVQPLLLDGETLGVMIVGNARSRRPFTPHEAKLCQSMAEQLAVAIRNARRYHAAQEKIQALENAENRPPGGDLPGRRSDPARSTPAPVLNHDRGNEGSDGPSHDAGRRLEMESPRVLARSVRQANEGGGEQAGLA